MFLLAAALAPTAQAALFIQDQFLSGSTPTSGEYVANTGVTDTGPTGGSIIGFTGNWLNGNTNGPRSLASGLTYSDGSNSLVTAGGSINAPGNTNTRGGRIVSSPITGTTTGTFYMSFLLQTNAASGGNYRALELHSGGFSDSTNRTLQLGMGGTGTDFTAGNYGLRINGNDSLKVNLGAGNTASNLFVLKFVLSDSNNSDTVTAYRNPTLGTEPMTATGSTSGFNFAFDRVTMANFQTGSQSLAMDEFRFGDTYASVTPVPEPTAALLAVLGLLPLLRLLRRKR